MGIGAIIAAIAAILDALARLVPPLAKELQAARDRADAKSRADAFARKAANDADLDELRAKSRSEAADRPANAQ